MSNLIDAIDKLQMKEVPQFRVGCTVKVNYRIIEGTKERIQAFEGVVIARSGSDKNAKATFTVRKVKGGFGVERIFPVHSPRIESIQVMKEGIVRQANLYYLRERSGKAARLKERIRRK